MTRERDRIQENANRYIVKNCPAFVLMRTATSGTYFNMCGNAKGHIKCADCTDCVIKRVIDKCKSTSDRWLYNAHVESFAKQILDMFDIGGIGE